MTIRRFGRSQGRRTVIRAVGGQVVVRFGDISTDDIVKYFEDLGLRMSDMQAVFDRYGEYIVDEHIPRQFRARGTPQGWAPLSPAYARWKATHYPGMPLLERTQRMKKGFRWEAKPRSLRIINRVTAGQSVRIPRWRFHQDGTGKMPARKMLQITQRDNDKLLELSQEYLEEAQE